jgi:hypothetical protein
MRGESDRTRPLSDSILDAGYRCQLWLACIDVAKRLGGREPEQISGDALAIYRSALALSRRYGAEGVPMPPAPAAERDAEWALRTVDELREYVADAAFSAWLNSAVARTLASARTPLPAPEAPRPAPLSCGLENPAAEGEPSR